jgi:hypothetical protein
MNTRLKELFDQADTAPWHPDDQDSFDVEKFARLIVEDCCAKLVEEGNDWLEFAKNPPRGQENHVTGALFAAARLREDAPDILREHFGIEP